MGRVSPLVWLLALLLLLPTAAGRAVIDVLGGLALVVLALPLLLGGLGWIGWKLIQSRMQVCPACGTATLQRSPTCPVCGSAMPIHNGSSDGAASVDAVSTPASSATIDITAEDVES